MGRLAISKPWLAGQILFCKVFAEMPLIQALFVLLLQFADVGRPAESSDSCHLRCIIGLDDLRDTLAIFRGLQP
jgi:hypothetical protein